MKYLLIFEKGESSYGAYVPDLPGCVAVGDSLKGGEIFHPGSRGNASGENGQEWG